MLFNFIELWAIKTFSQIMIDATERAKALPSPPQEIKWNIMFQKFAQMWRHNSIVFSPIELQ